jgi:hypothetical protein
MSEGVSEILASVIKGEVRLDLIPSNIHPRVREVLTRCLQKDLKRRYQDIGMCGMRLSKPWLTQAVYWCSRSLSWNLGADCERYFHGLQRLSFWERLLPGWLYGN